MKILVTGGAGFIGSNLVRLLIKEKGAAVINLDKLSYAGNPESLTDLKNDPNYHFEYGDLAAPIDKPGTPPSHLHTFLPSPRDQKSLVEIFDHYQPDAVMHLAAESHVDRSIDGPGEFIQTNIVGTYNLLQAALEYWRGLPEAESEKVGTCEGGNVQPESDDLPARKSFRFLHVSTDEVYGSLEPDAPAFTEASPCRPNSPYAASKAAADHLVRAWHSTYGLPTIITCCGNNYGPNQHPEKLIPKVIVCCHEQEPIPIYGDGFNIRDWIHVEDHTKALYAVLTKGRVGETYNIGANNEQTNLDLVKKLCEILEDEIRGKADSPSDLSTFQPSHHKSFKDLITFVADRPGHDMRYAIDTRKIRDELGWEPKEDFESGFRKTVQWYLENQDWWKNILSGYFQLGRLGKT